MKALILLLTIIVSGAGVVFAQAATRSHIIRFEEKVRQENPLFEDIKLPPKHHRVSSKRGDIRLLGVDEFPDSVKIALEAAKSLWEAKIHNKQPIYLEV